MNQTLDRYKQDFTSTRGRLSHPEPADLAHTREMLDGFRSAVPAARRIGTLVNTHSNGDHTFGNQLVSGARILASRACAASSKTLCCSKPRMDAGTGCRCD